MGKRIIPQARGHAGPRYRVKKSVFIYRLKYPKDLSGDGTVLKLVDSAAHSSPLAKIKYSKGIFYIPAFKEMIEGQKINFNNTEIKNGNITALKNIPVKTNVYCIESRPFDGGIFIKTAGTSGTVTRNDDAGVFVMMPSKQEKRFDRECRAVVGTIAGAGRLEKPFMKAGAKYYLKNAKGGRVWPKTSPIKVNIIDHPFGSGRGKNPKSKIAKTNSPPGARVELLRPRRTGRKKR